MNTYYITLNVEVQAETASEAIHIVKTIADASFDGNMITEIEEFDGT
jgi:hypothetical protein